jgi:uncharacterized protein (TIGR03083 family)
MIVERDVDCGAIYERQRRALVELLRRLDDAQLRTVVPASPLWSVRDVLAHVVGIAADLNALHFPSGEAGADAWTADQVELRRDRSVDDLAREWDVEAPRFEGGLRLLGYEVGSHYVADLAQHDTDVRAALGRPHRDDEEVLTVSLDFYLDYVHQLLVDARVDGALHVRAPDEEWIVGHGAIAATLRASTFDLFRAFGGRRSVRQLRALPWIGDVERMLPFARCYLPPEADVVDT